MFYVIFFHCATCCCFSTPPLPTCTEPPHSRRGQAVRCIASPQLPVLVVAPAVDAAARQQGAGTVYSHSNGENTWHKRRKVSCFFRIRKCFPFPFENADSPHTCTEPRHSRCGHPVQSIAGPQLPVLVVAPALDVSAGQEGAGVKDSHCDCDSFWGNKP